MSLPSSLRAAAAALLLAAPLALSACGTAENGVPASLAVPVGNGASLDAGGADSSALVRNGLSTAVTFVGTVMTSGGFTLYRNTKDRATPPTSTCIGACAASWPPVAADPRPTLNGVDAKLIGSLVRPDGSKQLTVAGWPVYRYLQDMAPGMVNGQGVDGVWQAVGADGKPITKVAAKTPTPRVRAQEPPTKPPATKAPVVAPKVVPTKAPVVVPPKVAPPKPPVVAPTTVHHDPPGTSSTD